MRSEITIRSSELSAVAIKEGLGATIAECPDLSLEVRSTEVPIRGLDTTVLVAVVGAAGTALGTLLGGLLNLAAQRGARKVVIVGKTGRRIEISGRATSEELEDYVRQARDLDVEAIEL